MDLAPLAQAVEEKFGCAHAVLHQCVKTASNGAKHYGWQCARCGDWKAGRKEERNQFSLPLPEFNEELREDWWKARQEFSRHLSMQRREADRREWFAAADTYYSSPGWRAKRAAVLKRDNGLCQARLLGCRTVANQAHHLTYDHWQDEPLFDLIAVCSVCHEHITESDRIRRQ